MLEPFVEQTYQSLGNNIYRFRILEQMSQVRLAEKSNVSAGYISQIECAHLCKGITLTSINKIAEALKLPVCVLLAEEPCQKYLECIEGIAKHIAKVR